MKSTYNQKTYILPMTSEVADAKVYIGYLTPFLSKTAIDLYESLLRRKLREGVRIDIFVEQPEDWDWDLDPRDAFDRDWLKVNIKRLEEMGCHVTLVQNFHEKALIIDYQVLWSGSINFLSSDPEKRSEKVDRDDDFLAVTNAYFRFNFERCCVCEKIEWNKIRGAKIVDLQSQAIKLPPSNAGDKNSASIPDIDEEPLGIWISALRQERNVSVNRLAKHCRVDRKCLANFELGKTIPPLKLLSRILKGLGYEIVIVPRETASIVCKIAKGYNGSHIAKMLAEKMKRP